MQPVGPAAVISEGKGTQLRKMMKMTEQNTHPTTSFSEIIQYCEKKTQPEVISWVGNSKFLYHSYDTLATLLFVSRNAISWLKGRSCLPRFMQPPVVILEEPAVTLPTNYLYISYQNLSAEKWFLVTYIRTRHTKTKWETKAEIHENILYLSSPVYIFRIC